MIDLTGLRAVVTGGSRGIGAACCRALAEAGAAVLVHYRERRDAAAEVLADLAPSPRDEHLDFAADLAEPEAIDALFDFVDKRWRGLDCLVNNAGIWVENPMTGFDRRRLEETWRVNLRAPFLCVERALPLLASSTRASIVNIASTAGQRGEARHSPYAASKAALVGATKSWSTELAPTVRVNAVAPGWVETEMCAEPFAEGGRDRIAADIPMGRVASPEDIAGAVAFLASPLARHVTGSVLSVNGGAVLAG